VYYLIGQALEKKLKDTREDYVDKFAKFLVEQCQLRRTKKQFDPVAVLSTNWDILLDNSLKSYIGERYVEEGVVDYCCYISSYRIDDDSVKPGLEKVGAGGFNVKLLKLHGSLNWLQCPRCSRVYVDFGRKIAIDHFRNPTPCRHCKKNFRSTDRSMNLVSNLIMPTFLKNLSNPQYKLIWHNAGIELSEADRLVFVGYSLPQADFEMRQLLARMVRGDASIEVVDFGDERDQKIIELKQRYSVFFGSRKIEFHLKGTRDFISSHVHG